MLPNQGGGQATEILSEQSKARLSIDSGRHRSDEVFGPGQPSQAAPRFFLFKTHTPPLLPSTLISGRPPVRPFTDDEWECDNTTQQSPVQWPDANSSFGQWQTEQSVPSLTQVESTLDDTYAASQTGSLYSPFPISNADNAKPAYQ